MYESPDKSLLGTTPGTVRFSGQYKDHTQIFAKTSRYRQDLEYYKKKGLERHTFTTYHQRDTSRLFEQFLFQGLICVSGTQ